MLSNVVVYIKSAKVHQAKIFQVYIETILTFAPHHQVTILQEWNLKKK